MKPHRSAAGNPQGPLPDGFREWVYDPERSIAEPGSMSPYRSQAGMRPHSSASHSIHSPPSRGEMHAAIASSAKSKTEDASTTAPVPQTALINEAINAELLI
jgi:hypothetical protein